MGRPKVSVVIATYNCGAYLTEAVASVLGQTVSDLELIVVDDGSTDDSRERVAAFRDERLRYAWQPNAGQTVAKNHGVRLAVGEFIGFCDGDDYWYPEKLAVQLPLFEGDPRVGVVYSGIDTIDGAGRRLDVPERPRFRGDVLDAMFLTNFVPFGTAVVRAACLARVGAFDETLRMGIDWDLWLRVSAHYRFDYVDAATYAYRVWGGQMSRNWQGRYESAFRIMEKFEREHPGAVSRATVRRGRANTYANRARASVKDVPADAIGDALRAIGLDPFEAYNWKTLARVAAEGLRASLPAARKA